MVLRNLVPPKANLSLQARSYRPFPATTAVVQKPLCPSPKGDLGQVGPGFAVTCRRVGLNAKWEVVMFRLKIGQILFVLLLCLLTACPDGETNPAVDAGPRADAGDATSDATQDVVDESTDRSVDLIAETGEEIGLGDLSQSSTFAEGRAYYVQLIEDEYNCEHSWELFNMNCYQTAEFCPDGSAEMMVTDIINSGTYVIDGQVLTFTRSGPGDVAETVVVDLISDTEIHDRASDVIWTLGAEDEFPTYCDE